MQASPGAAKTSNERGPRRIAARSALRRAEKCAGGCEPEDRLSKAARLDGRDRRCCERPRRNAEMTDHRGSSTAPRGPTSWRREGRRRGPSILLRAACASELGVNISACPLMHARMCPYARLPLCAPLTYCFSKKLENLEAAFAVFAACYSFCWQTRMPGESGKHGPLMNCLRRSS